MKKFSLLLLLIPLFSFGQLSETNITTTLVGNTIGNGSRNVGVLCTAPEINKWSKYKPVAGAYPQAGDGKYGLVLTNLWAYDKPIGGASEPFRLGDFRKYEHNQAETLPPAYVKFSGTSFASNPINDAVYYPNVSGQLILNDNGTANATEITLANLGLQNYYFGVIVEQPTHGLHWSKTMTSIATNAQVFSFNPFTDSPINGLFDDGSEKTVKFILSSQMLSSWQTAYPTTYYRLPHETVNGENLTSLEIIQFGLWMLCNGDNPSSITTHFSNNMLTGNYILSTGDISTNITASTYIEGWKIISKPSWLDLQVRTTDGGNRVLNPPYYDGGVNTVYIKGTLNQSNTGPLRSENIVLGKQDNTAMLNILCTQDAGPAILNIGVCSGTNSISPSSVTQITSSSISISYVLSAAGGWVKGETYNISVIRADNNDVLYTDDSAVPDLSTTPHTVTLNLSPSLIGGYTYYVRIKDGSGACIAL